MDLRQVLKNETIATQITMMVELLIVLVSKHHGYVKVDLLLQLMYARFAHLVFIKTILLIPKIVLHVVVMDLELDLKNVMMETKLMETPVTQLLHVQYKKTPYDMMVLLHRQINDTFVK